MITISDNPAHMPHITCTLHDPAIHLSSLIPISGGRYNLWSYTLCNFLQFPITFSHRSLQTDQDCSQTQFTLFPQCHRPSANPQLQNAT